MAGGWCIPIASHGAPSQLTQTPSRPPACALQSVALRLVCEREAEIEAFQRQKYFTVEGELQTRGGGTMEVGGARVLLPP